MAGSGWAQACTLLLKKAAERGLSPYQIGTLMCRDVDEDSVFEGLVAAAAAVALLPEGSTHGSRCNDPCRSSLLTSALMRDCGEGGAPAAGSTVHVLPGSGSKRAALEAGQRVKAGMRGTQEGSRRGRDPQEVSVKGTQGTSQGFGAGGSKPGPPATDLNDSAFVNALSEQIDVYFKTGLEKKMIEEGDPLRAKPHC